MLFMNIVVSLIKWLFRQFKNKFSESTSAMQNNLNAKEACESWNAKEQQTKAKWPSSGLVTGFEAPISSEEQHKHATINNPYVQTLDCRYIPLMHGTPEL